MSFLHELNPAQTEAVRCTDGPVMIIAGAGSGKTRVITYKVAWLVSEGADPFSILALTFTNKAAREMRNRIENLTNRDARNLWMGTFHSIFARILRREAEKIGFPSNFTIYDTQDSRSLLKAIINEQGLSDKIYKPNIIHNRISSAKNSLTGPEAYLKDDSLMSEDERAGRKKTADIYSLYWKRCFQAGAMDFDDLLFRMFLLLEQYPEVLYKYQHRFRYIMLDEYQDTNYAQYVITRKLADVHQNICVVGDDAQSIYAFRGANIQNIFNFIKDYPEVRTFKLEQNYRSTRNILGAANEVISHNKKQIEKKLWTSNDEGSLIRLVRAMSDNEEGRLVADHILEQKMRNHYRNSDFAILYRTNSQSRAFEEALRKLNIPYVVYGGLSFYQRKEIKDLLAYLRLAMNHYDEESLRRIINYPARGIGKATLEKAAVLADSEGKRYWDILENIGKYDYSNRTISAVGEFVTMIRSFAALSKTHSAYDMAMHVARSSGILKELYEDRTIEGMNRFENIEELLNGIKEFSSDDDASTASEDRSLGAWLQQITLLTDADDDDSAAADSVKVMTIHSAKGLEFPNVYIVGLEDNLFPSILSQHSREELEEERRLFYVGLTRAMKQVSLYFASTRFRFGEMIYPEPSPFISEIPEKYLDNPLAGQMGKQSRTRRQTPAESDVIRVRKTTRAPSKIIADNFTADDLGGLASGMEVLHQRFGQGKVLQLEGEPSSRIATIFFQSQGQKRIMLKYARLQILPKTGAE